MEDWNDLRFFLAVADAGSLSGASKQLKVNHSTVFRRITAFEERIGVRLFDRIDRRYHLTAAGEQILNRGQSISQAIHSIEREVEGQDYQLQGKVRITAPESIALFHLPKILQQLRIKYPGIDIELMISGDDYNLSRREADIAIRATSTPPDYLIGKKIGVIPYYFYASDTYLSSVKVPKTPQELIQHPIIGGDTSRYHIKAYRWLEDDFHQAIVMRCNSLLGMAQLARADVGVALLPTDHNKDLSIVCDTGQDFQSGLWLLTHPDLRHNARVKVCMDWIAENLSLPE